MRPIRYLPLFVACTPFCVGQVRMEDRFTISDCDGRNLDAIIQEAIVLVDNAIATINEITNTGPIMWSTKAYSMLRTAGMLWGFKTQPFIRPDSTAKSRLNRVKTNYERIQDHIKTGNLMRPDDNFIYCGTRPFQWTDRARTVYPYAPDVSTSTYWNKNGVWHDPQTKPPGGETKVWIGDQYPTKPGDPGYPQGKDLCSKPSVDAFTAQIPKSTTRWIMICPIAFQRNKPSVVAEDKTQKVRAADLDNYRSMPGVFIHEMAHYIYNSLHPEYIIDQVLRSGNKCYNIRKCFELANQQSDARPEDAVRNADSYRIFAEAAHFDKIEPL